MYTLAQYYGFEASVLPFCNIVETRNFSSDPVEAGLAATLGVDAAFNAFLTGIAELDYDSIPGDPDDPVTDRSWMWQYCSEYGQRLCTRLCLLTVELRLL